MGSLNQLPPWVEISGDVRLTPFYEMNEMKAKLDGFVADMNANITDLKTFGPASRYEIDDCRGAPGHRVARPSPCHPLRRALPHTRALRHTRALPHTRATHPRALPRPSLWQASWR